MNYKKTTFKIAIGVGVSTILICLTAFLLFPGTLENKVENTINFFGSFAGAMISAGVAAAFVIYSAKEQKALTDEQFEQQRRLTDEQFEQQRSEWLAEKLDEVRPTILLRNSTQELSAGDILFVNRDILNYRPIKEFVGSILTKRFSGSRIPVYFDLIISFGESIFNVEIEYEVFGKKNIIYLPILEPNTRNVIIDKNMNHFDLPSSKQRGKLYSLFESGVIIRFDTVMNEHVEQSYNFIFLDGKNQIDDDENNFILQASPTKTLSYDDRNTYISMKKLWESNSNKLIEKRKINEEEINSYRAENVYYKIGGDEQASDESIYKLLNVLPNKGWEDRVDGDLKTEITNFKLKKRRN